MNVDTMRVFCSVVQLQSFSRGTAANRLTQSAATQCIHLKRKAFTPTVARFVELLQQVQNGTLAEAG